ncbi:MAG: hypothetical protein RL469_1251, partial [Pseudomonadota bacterium]
MRAWLAPLVATLGLIGVATAAPTAAKTPTKTSTKP